MAAVVHAYALGLPSTTHVEAIGRVVIDTDFRRHLGEVAAPVLLLHGLLFVAHDFAAIKQMAHRVAVLHKGRIVELSSTQDLFRAPVHPYSRNLLETVGWKETKGASKGLTHP